MKPIHGDAFAALRLAVVLASSVWLASARKLSAPASPSPAALAGAPSPGPAAAGVCPGLVAQNPNCKNGPPTYCSGHGRCGGNGHCWCDLGYAGDDCSIEVPTYLEVQGTPPGWMADVVGQYTVDSMYLSTFSTNLADMRFIYYEPASSGWVVSKFNSSCEDDVCFFAYEVERNTPPLKGYVFGAPNMQVYCSQLLYDMAEEDPNLPRGKKLSLEYTPDPHVLTLPSLGEFNAQYVVQPRYVHASGKYMLIPINFADSRTWIITGMMGVPRKWRLLASAQGPLKDLYSPPLGFYAPTVYSLSVRKACANTYADAMCFSMAQFCTNTHPGFAAVKSCCRSTCNTCHLARDSCKASTANAVSFLSLVGKSANVSRGAMALLTRRHSTTQAKLSAA